LGRAGSRIEVAGAEPIHVPCADEDSKADPTGVGDAYRAGFLAGIAWGVSPTRCAQVGSMLATYVIETIGTQEYDLSRRHFVDRLRTSYGSQAADDVARHLRVLTPAADHSH
jgi:adenosine kinase